MSNDGGSPFFMADHPTDDEVGKDEEATWSANNSHEGRAAASPPPPLSPGAAAAVCLPAASTGTRASA